MPVATLTPSGFVWETNPTIIADNAVKWANVLHQAVYAFIRNIEPQVEQWMQANRPWTDRTTMARQTLEGATVHEANQYVALVLSHGAWYGWDLGGIDPRSMSDMARGQQYAIVIPAIDFFGPDIMAGLQRMLGYLPPTG